MHRLRTWTRGHIAVLRAWQRHVAHRMADWPRLTAIYAQLKALPPTQQTQWRRRCKATLWGVALCLVASGYAGEVQAGTTINVGASSEVGLMQAILAANSEVGAFVGADTIVLTNSTFTFATAYSDSTALPTITSEITIAGNGSTILRAAGAPAFRLLRITDSGDLTLLDTTLSGGRATDGFPNTVGGAIFNYYGQLRLEGCLISGNYALYFGGGVFSLIDGSDMGILNSTLSGNGAFIAGGGVVIGAFDSSTVSIVNSTLSGNGAFFGGGGVSASLSDSSTASLVNSTFTSNVTSFSGGGMSIHTSGSSMMSLVNSTVSGNSARFDGGGCSVSPLTAAR